MLPGTLPVFHQFGDVAPLQYVRQCPPRETTPQNRPIVYPDGCLVVAVGRVEVRRIVILVEHADHDPQEAADLRHCAYSTRTG